MNPEYVVLGGLFWRLLKKKISLWYVHRQVNFKLRIAEKLCSKIFSVSPESFRVKSKQVSFVGHGIDTKKFKCGSEKLVKDKFQIISVGRITRIKNLDVLIKAVALLPDQAKKNVCVKLVGAPVTADDKIYQIELKEMVENESLVQVIRFLGATPYAEIVSLYCESGLLVNLAPTGGSDKAVLESMSCGVPVLVANEAYRSLFGELDSKFVFNYNDHEDLANKMVSVIYEPTNKTGGFLRQQIVKNNNIESLIKKIVFT